jgi:hypothetical protein
MSMSCVLSSHRLVKHEMTDAERAESAVHSVKLKHLTTRQVHLPKGSGNSGISPNEKKTPERRSINFRLM